MLKLYIDETGRTGRHVYQNAKWNYDTHKYFALGGLLLDEEIEKNFIKDIIDITHKFHIQGELKYTNKSVKKKKDKIITEFKELNDKYNVIFLSEIVNQRFCDCIWIAEYAVIPYYDSSNIDSFDRRMILRALANYIYYNINDNVIWDFVELFDNNSYDKNKLISCCKQLTSDKVLKPHVEETIDSIKTLPLEIERFFPIKDYFKNQTSSFAINPHIDSFNNILNRINPNYINNIKIIHDTENELSYALNKWASIHNTGILFEHSKHNPLIQVTDFFVGYSNEIIKSMLDNGIYQLYFKDFINNINIVSTIHDQLKLFPFDEESRQVKSMFDYLQHLSK